MGAMPCHAMPCHVVDGRGELSGAMPCHVPCHAVDGGELSGSLALWIGMAPIPHSHTFRSHFGPSRLTWAVWHDTHPEIHPG